MAWMVTYSYKHRLSDQPRFCLHISFETHPIVWWREFGDSLSEHDRGKGDYRFVSALEVPDDLAKEHDGYLLGQGGEVAMPIPDSAQLAQFGSDVVAWLKRDDYWCFEDGTDLCELAVTAGLLQRVKYEPADHGEVRDAEPGDEIFWWGNADADS